jgi:enolase
MTAMTSSRVELERKREERKKEKQEAIAYLTDKGAQKKLELLLNEAVRLKPDDLFGYLTRESSRLSSPATVDKIVGTKAIDIGGQTAVKVIIHCVVNGASEAVESAICCLPPPMNVTQAARSQSSQSRSSKTSANAEEPSHSSTITNKLETIEEIIAKSSQILTSKEIANIQELDSCLQCPDISVHDNASATWTVSLALAKSACRLLHRPLYKMVAMLTGIDPQNGKLFPPLVIGKMLSGGPASNGKLRIRDFCVTPSDKMDYEEGIRSVCKFHQSLGKILVAKLGVCDVL